MSQNLAQPQTRQNVALVLVSHSRALAEAVAALAEQMTSGKVPIICAAGAGDKGELLGTDAVRIMQAIESVNRPEGVLVLMDLGSALLSTDMALDLIDPSIKENVHVAPCAFVEGAVAAAASAASGAPIDEIMREAVQALDPKIAHLGGEIKPNAPTHPIMSGQPDASEEVAIPDPNGLHARPAAKLTTLAGSFQARVTISNKTRNTKPASANSLVGLSSLGARHNDILVVSAFGVDAQKAVDAFVALIKTLTGTEITQDTPKDKSKDSNIHSNASDGTITPIPVTPGIAFGKAYYLNNALPKIPTEKITDREAEKQRLKKALDTVEKELTPQSKTNDIISVQLALLKDPALTEETFSQIESESDNAAMAWQESIKKAVKTYETLDDPYLRGRATDIKDLGLSVMRALLGASKASLPKGKPYILIADELPPSVAAQCDPDYVLGVVDRKGGRTSHAAILLRAMGIPTLVGAAQQVSRQDIKEIGFDGSTGEIWIDPDEAARKVILQKQALWQAAKNEAEREVSLDVKTQDGFSVTLMANVSGAMDAKAALKAGAKGIGLLRTEMLFAERETAPSEEEQIALLSDIFLSFKGFPIIVRTLDAGGDKPLSYLPMSKEENPFLGERGIRFCLNNKPFFRTQLRALLRAGEGYDMRIMLPMVTEVSELLNAKALLEETHNTLQKDNIPHIWPVLLGIMVEVPAAAIKADKIAEHADFFSIGTNDLTQYVLAAERGNPRLEHFSDAVHPAVLQLIETVVKAGAAQGRHVSVCGEAAGDPFAAALLLGLGVKSLSMGAGSLSNVRTGIRGHLMANFVTSAQQALTKSDAQSVRQDIKLEFKST